MKNNPVIIEEVFNVSAERIWQALTDKGKMKQWYFDLKEFKPEIGFEFRFKGEGRQGEKYMHLCKVTQVIPNKKLQYSWQYENYEGRSLVTFELFADGDKTRLRLTHEGLETFPKNHPDFSRESFTGGWTEIIKVHLRQFLNK